MAKSCKEMAKTLYDCMKNTPCMKEGGDIKTCMKTHEECSELRRAYFECKRSGLDMRTRIRGQRTY